MEQTELHALRARIQAIEEREENRDKRIAEASPEATPPSQRRSSVASTELLQPEHALMAPASYPVMVDETFHCRPIPEGYARVMVDEITERFEDLQLDHPTGEGETRLG